ncbi:MAG: TrkA family potassium uptake protein [Ignavibacteriaceae bacterium]
MKQFVVIGLGNFGLNVAKALASRGNQVLAIDIDQNRIDEVKDDVSEAIIADAKNTKVLNEFITSAVDAVIICIGQNMEASILTTHYLKQKNVKRIIVKAMNENHARILELMGADEVILPEKDIAISLAQKLSSANLLEHIPLTSEFSIVEAAVPENFAGKTLKQLQLRSKYNLLVIAVKDVMQDKFYLMPDAGFELIPDSLLIIMGRRMDVERFKI